METNKKDGSKFGMKRGGRGLNQTDDCRHPDKKSDSQKKPKDEK